MCVCVGGHSKCPSPWFLCPKFLEFSLSVEEQHSSMLHRLLSDVKCHVRCCCFYSGVAVLCLATVLVQILCYVRAACVLGVGAVNAGNCVLSLLLI